MDYPECEYLAHHGIKGQKWGVRRTAAQLGHKVSSAAKGAGSGAKVVGKAVGSGAKAVGKGAVAVGKKVGGGAKAVAGKVKAKNDDVARKALKRDEEGNSTKLKKTVKSMSTDELKEQISRLKTEQELRDLQHPGMAYTKNLMKETISSIAKDPKKYTDAALTVAKLVGAADKDGILITEGQRKLKERKIDQQVKAAEKEDKEAAAKEKQDKKDTRKEKKDTAQAKKAETKAEWEKKEQEYFKEQEKASAEKAAKKQARKDTRASQKEAARRSKTVEDAVSKYANTSHTSLMSAKQVEFSKDDFNTKIIDVTPISSSRDSQNRSK